MRSYRDLDSKTPRHNREGFTPREPPHPEPSTSVKTITQRRRAAGGERPGSGMVPPQRFSLCSASPTNSLQLCTVVFKPLENSCKWNSGAMFG